MNKFHKNQNHFQDKYIKCNKFSMTVQLCLSHKLLKEFYLYAGDTDLITRPCG